MAGDRVGAYAAGDRGIHGGFIDYVNMINLRDGGVNGVKLDWMKSARPSTTTPAA